MADRDPTPTPRNDATLPAARQRQVPDPRASYPCQRMLGECSRCGQPVGADDRFCGRCGWPQPAQPPAEPPAPPSRPARWRAAWTWVPVAAAIAVLVVTNPSRQAYSRWLAAQLTAGTVGDFGGLPATALANALTRGTLAQNDVIFTIFDTRLRGVHWDVLGIFGRFVPLGMGPVD
jgi:hypothetical protein